MKCMEKSKFESGIKLNFNEFINYHKNIQDNYKWVYIGPEFCENLLPLYLKYIDIIKSIKKNICFLLPPFTDKNTTVLKNILLRIASYKNVKEITINDFGTFWLVKKLRLNIKINIGRYLSKNFFVLKHQISLDDPGSILFLKNLDIKRYELSTTHPKISLPSGVDIYKAIKLTLYTPYVDVGITRLCPLMVKGNQNMNSKNIDLSCNYECLKHKTIKLNKFLLKGNVIYKKITCIQNKLKKLPEIIDRIIHEL